MWTFFHNKRIMKQGLWDFEVSCSLDIVIDATYDRPRNITHFAWHMGLHIGSIHLHCLGPSCLRAPVLKEILMSLQFPPTWVLKFNGHKPPILFYTCDWGLREKKLNDLGSIVVMVGNPKTIPMRVLNTF